MENFLDLADIHYINSDNAKLYSTVNGFAAMEALLPPKDDDLVSAEDSGKDEAEKDMTPIWQDVGRVYFHRMFPFDTPDDFISVLDKDGNEYGIIRHISDFDGVEAYREVFGELSMQADIIRHELARKYLCPEIKTIISLKEQLGYSYWEVDTDYGRMSFTMYDTYRNLAKVGDNRIVLQDVDGNRFGIFDVTAIDPKSYKKIELYL